MLCLYILVLIICCKYFANISHFLSFIQPTLNWTMFIPSNQSTFQTFLFLNSMCTLHCTLIIIKLKIIFYWFASYQFSLVNLQMMDLSYRKVNWLYHFNEDEIYSLLWNKFAYFMSRIWIYGKVASSNWAGNKKKEIRSEKRLELRTYHQNSMK